MPPNAICRPCAAARGPRRQVVGDRIVQRHDAALHHVCEQQRRERLRHRRDLERRVAVDRPSVARLVAPCDTKSAVRPRDDADHHPDALVLNVDLIDEQCLDPIVRRRRPHRAAAAASSRFPHRPFNTRLNKYSIV